MQKTFCLLNHQLTSNQIKELEQKFSSTVIVYPPKDLGDLWSQIPPRMDRLEVAKRVIRWLEAEGASSKDLFIVQGEFGSTFMLVDWALKAGLIPIYASTHRVAKEIRKGEQVFREYIFEHECFNLYRCIDE